MQKSKCLYYGCRIGLVDFLGGHLLVKDNTYTAHLHKVKKGEEELKKLVDTFNHCPDCGHEIDWLDWGIRFRKTLGIKEDLKETNQ